MKIRKARWLFQTVGALLGYMSSASAQFIPAPNPPYPFPIQSGQSPISVVVGNFKAPTMTVPPGPLPVSTPDLAVANQIDGTVTLILSNGPVMSNGAGGFSVLKPIAVGKYPSSMVEGPFNKNGLQDLVVANQGDNTITVLLNDGNGWVKPTVITLGPFPGGISPDFVAMGDFNGDGIVDLAIANRDSNNVTVLLGQGNGMFTPAAASPFAVGNSPSCIAVGDFNGDGKPDLAITNELDNTVTILLGDGLGGFHQASASPFPVGLNPSFIVTADFNGDGNLDLAVADLNSNNLTVLLGNGNSGFKPAPGSPVSVGTNPISIAVADFNLDTIPDLAVANYGSNNVTVLLGNGSGGFKPGTGSPFTVGAGPRSVAVGDFNADGVPDLVIADSGSGDVTVLLNTFSLTPVMVSGASFSPTAPVAPGSIVSIFGTGLSSLPPLVAPVSPPQLPTCLNWMTVSLTDSSGAKNLPLTLSYVSATQIDGVVPPTAATGAATFTISPSSAPNCAGSQPASSQTAASQKGSVTVASVAPSLFSANSTGKGVAAGLFVSDLGVGTPMLVATCPTAGSCTANPLNVSSGTGILVLYGTGIHNRVNLSDVTVTIGSQSLPAFYAGISPDIPGADQVNVTVPKSLAAAGTVFVTVSIAGSMSNQVTLTIQ
jgi:uncharacterized protein (TIGR03437 family)